MIDDGWNEAQVREDLRRSAESREGIVRGAYRSVLSREPDRPSDGYVEHVLRDGWTFVGLA